MNQKLKNNKAITLVALVITIIILLILAGVSIAGLTGENSIISNSKEAKKKATIAEEMEIIKLAYTTCVTDNIIDKEEITVDKVRQEINELKEATVDQVTEIPSDAMYVDAGEETGKIIDITMEYRYYIYIKGENIPDEENPGDELVEGVTGNLEYFTYTYNTDNMTAILTGVKDEYAVKGYYYDDAFNAAIQDGEERITNIIIPSETKDEEGNIYTVTEIGTNVFANSMGYINEGEESSITSVVIPGTIEKIADGAFKGCGKLERVIIKDGNLKDLPNEMFHFCSALVEVQLPSQIESIGNSAFYYCDALETLTLPANLKTIGNEAFEYSTKLDIDNFPVGLQSIGDYAFDGCESLDSLVLPNTLKTIGNDAFIGCISLTTIVFPEGLESIGYYAFGNCDGLKNVILPESLESLDSRAFINCVSLEKIFIPKTLVEISASSYSNSPFYCYSWNSPESRALKIYTDVESSSSVPSGWGTYWKYYSQTGVVPVEYGYTLDQFKQLIEQ